jgi:type 1 glutamine amidotransferase
MNNRSSCYSLILVALVVGSNAARSQPYPVPDPDKIQVLIITGQHVHDWPATTPRLRAALEETGKFEVRVTEEFRGAGAETLAPYDLVVVNYYDRRQDPQWRWGAAADNALSDFVRSGKGLVLYHLALGAFYGWEDYEAMSGGNWRDEQGHHSPTHDFELELSDRRHPITRGLKSPLPVVNDELYANLAWQPDGSYHVLATAYDDHSLYTDRVRQPIPGAGRDQSILWTTQFGAGRVFVTALGHAGENVLHPTFKVTFARGAEWAATGDVTLAIPAGFASD